MKQKLKHMLFGALLTMVMPVSAEKSNCQDVVEAVKASIASQPENTLVVVVSQVANNNSCVCEIVKAAITASDADKKLVAQIVEAAIQAAPTKVRIIGQCAVAVAPDALVEVQEVVTKYAAVSGDSGLADAKGGGGEEIVAAPPIPTNPLDFPGQGPIGPTPGGPGGFPLFPPGLQPPTVAPPTSTSEELIGPR